MEFKKFAEIIHNNFQKLQNKYTLFRVNVDNDIVWNLYLDSFPPGTNEIYKERRQYDCNCCHQFIKYIAPVVVIINNKLVSIWDITLDDAKFSVVANALKLHMEARPIQSILTCFDTKIGANNTAQVIPDQGDITWHHFYCNVNPCYVDNNNHESIESFDQLKRVLIDISSDALEIIIDLINQNSIYRGSEFINLIKGLLRLQSEYDQVDEHAKDLFIWDHLKSKSVKFRNSVIGSLATDISEGKDLTQAVKSYEAKVAPTNYKRSKTIVTESMIKIAMKTIYELNLEESLYRRYAVTEDIRITDVLFADRSTSILMKNSIENLLLKSAGTKKPQNFDKIEEIDINDFINNILPKVSSLELKVDNVHIPNLMSLIAPVNIEAPCLTSWDNNFSWSYNGGVTDSIKEKVKQAGGQIQGVLRASLSWYNRDDLDIHAIEPNGIEISYNSKVSKSSGGALDIDMNANADNLKTDAVENIIWSSMAKMEPGIYKIKVHNYALRDTNKDVGFEIEIEFDGQVFNYFYAKEIGNRKMLSVVDIAFDGKHFKIDKVHQDITVSNSSSKEIWNININQFVKVNMILLSPNHWDEKSHGNKHYLFILDECNNPESCRGLYNEFLPKNLWEHRKVFELLGSKLLCEHSNHQLSGLGFSSTQKNTLICRVRGSFNRTIKIKF